MSYEISPPIADILPSLLDEAIAVYTSLRILRKPRQALYVR